MNETIKKSSVFIWVMMALLVTGCEKMVDVGLPADLSGTSSIFQDSATAQTAVNGMYTMLYNSNGTNAGIYSSRISMLPARSADEQAPAAAAFDNFSSNSLVPGNPDVSDLWANSYNIIYIANSIIEGTAASSTITPLLKKQLAAEAGFIRAFCHFYLVNYFGKVPLITSTAVTITSTAPASSIDSVYARIIEDLTNARDVLATDYSWSGGDRTRVNSQAASALLARVYLYRGQWALAEAEATRVIGNTGLYSLVRDPNKVFLANSTEAVWQFYTNVWGYTYYANYNIPSGLSVPDYTLSNYLLSAFEPNDVRKSDWTGSISILGGNYTYAYKYKSKTNDNTEFETVLRLGELYLIRAEARAQQGNISGAQDDLNVIRSRAGLAGTTAGDQASLLLAIEHERQVELFCEWGHRWLDLKRTGRADAVLSVEKPAGWQATDTLYPIPTSAISTNPNLKQNKGYN